MADKKDTKVKDLKPNKDAKGGGPGQHGPPKHEHGAGPTHGAQGGHPTHGAQGGGGSRGGI